MAKRLKLTGQSFGALQVLGKGTPRIYGGQERPQWRCLCGHCGQVEEFMGRELVPPHSSNTHGIRYVACRACSRKTCSVCLQPIPSQRKHLRESPACASVANTIRCRAAYARRTPEQVQRAQEEASAQWRALPEAARQALAARRREQYRLRPEIQEAARARARAAYARSREVKRENP